MITDLLYFN